MAKTSIGQIVDRAPKDTKNILAVEGQGIRMNIDSITPLDSLIERLNGYWKFIETGKGYWIGYTEDMYSIASRGDTAITLLTNFFENTKSQYGKIGAIYTLHLIGIESRIAGRFYEEFKNPKARAALLKLLRQTDYTYSIMSLLKRDPWKSDLPNFFQILKHDTSEAICWPIINSLNRYNITALPINNEVPDSINKLRTNIIVYNDNDFNGQIKDALKRFKTKFPNSISVEEQLFKKVLTGDFNTNLPQNLSISKFLDYMSIARNYPFNYCDMGCKIQYYVENGKLYICTISTARARLLKWYKNLSVEEKSKL